MYRYKLKPKTERMMLYLKYDPNYIIYSGSLKNRLST